MSEGASRNERLFAAAKQNNEELAKEVLAEPGLDVNLKDGVGNTALHYAAQTPAQDVIDHILEYDNCDVDPQNRLDRFTPLHLAAKLEDPDLREFTVRTLVESGANINIPDKYGRKAKEFVPKDDLATLKVFQEAEKELRISKDDIASDGEGDDDEPPSDSDDN